MHYSEAEEKSKNQKIKNQKSLKSGQREKLHKNWCWFLNSNSECQMIEKNSFQSAAS